MSRHVLDEIFRHFAIRNKVAEGHPGAQSAPAGGKDFLMLSGMQLLALRIEPGRDVRGALEALLCEHGAGAAFVLQGIGSLSVARLRLAGAGELTELSGDLEILTLAGSVSPDGAHLHMTLADAQGRVLGGHVGAGCMIRTTAEILLALLPDCRFGREQDPVSGFRELVIRARPGPGAV